MIIIVLKKVFGIWNTKYHLQKVFGKVFEYPKINLYAVFYLNTNFWVFDTTLVGRHTGRWWVGCYIWYSEEGTGRGPSSPRPLLAVPKWCNSPPINGQCTNHCIAYNGPLLSSFNAGIKGLSSDVYKLQLIVTIVIYSS